MIRQVLIPALAALLLALLIHTYNDFAPIDSFLSSSSINISVDIHYSDSYYQARKIFRLRAEAAGAQLFSLPLQHIQSMDLTVDIAVLEGSRDRVLLHISGTHGVEGFAGSAIQAALLEREAASQRSADKKPTVIFVHALNAYGFAKLRRCNEHGIDLNRNWLTPEEFQEHQARDPNRVGYMDVFDLLNPKELNGFFNSVWLKSLIYLTTMGFESIKQATVNGNYHFPQTLYYGGTELEPSLALLQDFLLEHVDFSIVTKFAMVDVHTGLGPSGVDTLMLGSSSNMTLARNVFAGPEYANKVVFIHDHDNPVSRGYDGVNGFTFDGVAKLSGSQNNGNAILVCQEFGTVPGIFILKALIEENTVYYHYPSSVNRLSYAQKLRDVFYLHRSSFWKSEVLHRGVAVFDRLNTYLEA
ncbi:RxLR-like protein [Plasmopara halstedii]|uniref:RxLR-like protein n=1 Tax=Plasmopara halstedii TaxID=4781 RepID=A0A0P1B7A6_PLAHL|nr:RxLR-like protein [Plasmopara halstedii]CEG50290.1 RxLR-like protein [Plasmopara halstedii]|eukprot:XP_024586659.1 RxLR-like protein [Plasmopara halstedii]